jgi:osmotically inducible protein OsmC
MKLAFILQAANYTAKDLITDCVITLDNGSISSSQLTLKATIDGVSDEEFGKMVKDAEENCPISKLLNTEISVSYTLNK